MNAEQGMNLIRIYLALTAVSFSVVAIGALMLVYPAVRQVSANPVFVTAVAVAAVGSVSGAAGTALVVLAGGVEG